MNRVWLALAAMVPVLALAPRETAAAEWSWQSSAQLFSEYQSNPRLLSEQAGEAIAVAADARLGLRRSTELLDLGLDAWAHLRRYRQDADLDRDERRISLSMQRQWERWSLSGSASTARDTTLTSELASTGEVGENIRHRLFTASLAPGWQLSERATLAMRYGWQQHDYDQTERTGLVDYRYRSISASAGWRASERADLELVAAAGRMDGADAGQTDNLDLLIRASYRLSPLWKGSLAGGPSRVESGAARTGGSVFSVTLERRDERLGFSASAERSTAPSGRGSLSRRDQAGMQLSRVFSGQLDAAVSVSHARSREYLPRSGLRSGDSRYTRAELSLSWRFAPDWSLGAAAGYSELDQQFPAQGGRSQDARLVLAWRRAAPP